MSTDCSRVGFSIPFIEEYQNQEAMMKIIGAEDQDDFDHFMYDSSDKLKQWQITSDYDGKFGLVYFVMDEWDNHYLEFSSKIKDLNEVRERIPKEYLSLLNIEELKIFAFVYYNGSDSPFKF